MSTWVEQVRIQRGVVLYTCKIDAERIEHVNCGFVIVDRFGDGLVSQGGTEFRGWFA